jgi:hypothetical protein
MRLNDVVGRPVVTVDGEELGKVHDVLLVQDGPVHTQAGTAGLRVHALAVGRRALGTQLGYTQGTVRGPWLLRAWFGRPPVLVPWAAIVRRDADRIVVDLARAPAVSDPDDL